MGIGGEISKAGDRYVDTVKNAGKETWNSKSAGELLGNVLMVQPAKMALGIFGITMQTSLKISGILALRGLKTVGKGLLALPLIPTGGPLGSPNAPRSDYAQMAQESPIEFSVPR